MLLTIATLLGLPGLFGSRVFLPMFVAAIALRFGPEIPWAGELGLLAGVGPVPGWFGHEVTLASLGVLSIVEVAAGKNAEARAVLDWIDRYAKPIMAALTALGILSAADAAVVGGQLGPDEASVVTVGVALAVAVATFVVATVRAAVLEPLTDVDDGDATGIGRLLSIGEDLWAAFGVLFLILFPVVMLALIGLAMLGLFALQRRAAAREEAAKFACPQCGRDLYKPALHCPHCGRANPRPTRLNWLGAATDEPADAASQPAGLLAKGRCPRCATRLPRRTADPVCDACGTRPFGDGGLAGRLDRHVSMKLPTTLVACAALSAVPIVGLVPGVILYRLRLVGPYRRYIGRGRGVLLRVGVKVAFVLLVAVQWVPIAGAATVPAMALLSWAAHRRAFRSSY